MNRQDFKALALSMALTVAVCPTGHEAWFNDLRRMSKQEQRIINNDEPWRGRGKRKMRRVK